jgi:hypothetical protein
MKLFLFSVSVFYLLGLKLSSQTEVKSSLDTKPAIIKSNVIPEIKHELKLPELKPELSKKDTTTSTGIKSIYPTAPSVKVQKSNTLPRS